MILPEEVKKVLSMLEDAGFEAYLVGGCVRDFLLGTVPHDFDIATNALPEGTEKVFADFPVIETGLKHGTVTVFMNKMPLEITTYRSDGSYSDGRHPDQVHFTHSLEEDLARRDFTINAIAYSPKRGIVDLFGGQRDLRKEQICTVGEAKERFTEDALRIVRALRFSSALGFSIEEQTAAAARALKERLSIISAERIYTELTKLLCGENVRNVLINYPEILGVWLPELLPMVGFHQHNFHHIYTVWEHTASVVEAIPPVPHLRWAALLHDCGKPGTFSMDAEGVGHFYGHHKRSTGMAEDILDRLKADNNTKTKVTALIRRHDTPLEQDPKCIKRILNKLGTELFFDLIKLQRADNMGQAPQFRDRQQKLDGIEAMALEILNTADCFSLKSLAVSGEDLIALGIPTGPAMGKILNLLLEAVIDGQMPNEKNTLLLKSKEYYAKIESTVGGIKSTD